MNGYLLPDDLSGAMEAKLSSREIVFRVLAVVLALAVCQRAMAEGRVSFKSGTDKIEVQVDSKPLATFYYGKEWSKPFMHGLRAPSEVIVTRGFPVAKIAGESNDHGWHRGLWFAHGDISGVDFWREAGGDHTSVSRFPLPLGLIVAKSAPQTRVRGGRGVLTAELKMITSNERKPMGSLREEFTFQRQGANSIVDVRVTVVADEDIDLKFGDTEEGTLGFRFRDEFRQDRGATLRNSEGLTGTEKIWGKKAKWTDYSGTRQGRKAGAAFFDHPSNPRHPTYWHARGYGMNAVNPVGVRDFAKDKTLDGSLSIPAGQQVRFFYRIVLHDGDANDAAIDKRYDTFAKEKPRGL